MTNDNIVHRVLSYFNLENELDDFDKIHQSIKKDVVFKGTNLWILMFAIIVASVGLNMNSTAVIIGAMLISPLMGPINGMGYAIAIYDMSLFRLAVRNFSFAVVVSLVASTTYFFLSPISTAHSELLARTSPTIYDVLIALFGGLAGIVAISSRFKGNVIPGVAIATALMPPLCTAGYGLATAQFDFFFGAIFLFTINTVFIALSSVAVSQILNFPISERVAVVNRKRINSWITVVIVLVAIPSIYFGYKLVQKERFVQKSNEFIAQVGIFDGNFLLKSEIKPEDKQLNLIFGGANMSEEQKNNVVEMAHIFLPDDAQIHVKQGLATDLSSTESAETKNMKNEISRLNEQLLAKENMIDSLTIESNVGKMVLNEIKSIYPVIESCSYSRAREFNASSGNSELADIVVFQLKSGKLNSREREKIAKWLSVKLSSENIRVFYRD